MTGENIVDSLIVVFVTVMMGLVFVAGAHFGSQVEPPTHPVCLNAQGDTTSTDQCYRWVRCEEATP